jgi:hypothetical protein
MNSPTYPCANVPEVPEAHYSRLCPGEWQEFDPDQLRDLAELMRDSPTKRAARKAVRAQTITVPSGYVYLGQFIDHDITRDVRTLAEAGPDAEQTINYRTPRLDLDLLYGKDPARVPCIYEEDKERLKLGPTVKLEPDGQTIIVTPDDDLPRKEGTAIVVDPRSDENLLIAQLHVIFAKFHNRVIALLRDNPTLSVGPVGGSLFDQARRFVTWHYQWIVINDFLPKIARLSVLEAIDQNGFRLYPRRFTPGDGPVALPLEFTVAAFRFGHSMVQDQYNLNDAVVGVPSSEIIKMTKRGTGITDHLPSSHIVDWLRFFRETLGGPNSAQHIDTFITEMLYDLPKPAKTAFRFQQAFMRAELGAEERMAPPLPELTLKRGSKVRLPSGQEFAECFGYERIAPADIPALPEAEFPFPAGMQERTPLWYYLLREAVVAPNDEPIHEPDRVPPQKLGPIGSRIVAETLYQLLNADCESIAYAPGGWKPPAFTFGQNGQRWRLRSMSQLIRFAKAF